MEEEEEESRSTSGWEYHALFGSVRTVTVPLLRDAFVSSINEGSDDCRDDNEP